MSGLSKNVSGGGNIELSAALHELKEWTSVTMETVGIRCQKRVNTSVYKKGLAQLKGAQTGCLLDAIARFPPSSQITQTVFLTLTPIADDVAGEVMVQPPNEDRVSVFTSLQGGKQASIKLFSTGKIRCLKSDFKSLVRIPPQKIRAAMMCEGAASKKSAGRVHALSLRGRGCAAARLSGQISSG